MQDTIVGETIVGATLLYVGCDVHAATISVAIAPPFGQGPVQSLGTIPNTAEAVRGLIRRLERAHPHAHLAHAHLAVWYEAGPCGYVLQRQLTALGVGCQVAAPTLVPTRPGDRIKTYQRDARKLAELARGGYLTTVRIPDEAEEALRDLVRARADARADVTRARQRIRALLLRLGIHYPGPGRAWTLRHRDWLARLTLAQPAQEVALREQLQALAEAEARLGRLEAAMVEQAAQSALAELIAAYQALRGIEQVTAITLAVELDDLSRFANPRQVMAYVGIVPREHSSGERQRHGRITKTGNAAARHLLIEAAHHARHTPRLSQRLLRRQQGVSPAVCQISWNAQGRLHKRYRGLLGRGKPKPLVVTAVARELVGFLWAIAVAVARERAEREARAVGRAGGATTREVAA
jgi:transposase